MIFRGLLDLIRLLCIVALSAIREGVAVLVHLIGAPGVVIIAIALLWWFGWLPGIVNYAASIFG